MIYQILLNKLNNRDRELFMAELGLGNWSDENAHDMAKRCRSVWPMPPAKQGEDPKNYTLNQLVRGVQRMKIDDILNSRDESGRNTPESDSPD